MNMLGCHAQVWVGDWTEESAARAATSTAEAGFDLLEVPVLDPGSIDVAMTRRVLEQAGLRAACSMGLSRDADISSDDPGTAKRGQELLLSALDVVRGIGAQHLTGVLYSALHKYAAPLTPRGRENVVEGLRVLASRAADDGITIGLEVVNRYETNVVNTAAETLALLDDVGAENVVVHLDTYHMNIEESDFVTPVLACGPRLGYVHVGESHRGYLGSGTVDLPALFAALVQVGYEGPITFESFSSAVVSENLSNTLAVWRNLWDDSADLAGHAQRVIADGMHATRSTRR